MAFVYGISVYPTDMIMRWWSVAPIGWSIVHYSITVLQSWNIKKIYIYSVLAFFCVCAVSESSYMTILTIFCFHLKSSPPPDPEFAFIGLLTSSWTLGEWDVTFPPPVTHNVAVASDSPADARLSKPAYQWRLIPLYSLHASRMASSMLATANASLSAGWDDVYCCQSRTRSQRKWRCTPAVISDQEKLAANYIFLKM